MVTGLKGNRSDLKMEATQPKSSSKLRIIWWLTRERERDEGKSKSFTLQGFPERSMKSLISMSLARRKVPILLALEAPASLDSVMFDQGRDWKPISNLGFAERDLSNRPHSPTQPFISCCIRVHLCFKPKKEKQWNLYGQTQPLMVMAKIPNDVTQNTSRLQP